MIKLAVMILVLFLTSSPARAEMITTIVFRNHDAASLEIWVDGILQGSHPGGEGLYYIPKEGFVRANGSLQGGWDSEGGIHICAEGKRRDGTVIIYEGFVTSTVEDNRASVAFGGEAPDEAPLDTNKLVDEGDADIDDCPCEKGKKKGGAYEKNPPYSVEVSGEKVTLLPGNYVWFADGEFVGRSPLVTVQENGDIQSVDSWGDPRQDESFRADDDGTWRASWSDNGDIPSGGVYILRPLSPTTAFIIARFGWLHEKHEWETRSYLLKRKE